MYDDVTLYQQNAWLGVIYMAVSAIFAWCFWVLKRKKYFSSSSVKVSVFITILSLAFSQYLIFRFGMSDIYELLSLYPARDLYIRLAALLFCIVYLYFLPIRMKTDFDARKQ
ncbi:hypothetical protein [Erwinia sp. 9145]|uniref:hypothetical protein n=1 Tax=Erwinia sp. 9145 TaxID=1500895 RepID=UPI00054D6D8D|nr:hypothetical protein [Erwinia sp. 9145]